MTRITTAMSLRTAIFNINAQRERLATTEEQVASGLRINRPSDDPSGAAQAARLRAEDAAVNQYQRNVDAGSARLVTIEGALDDSLDLIQRARELAVQGATDTQDAASREILAIEVESLYEQLLSMANQRHSGSYVFGGTRSSTPPFSSGGSFGSGTPPMVTFLGDSTELDVSIGSGSRVTTTLDGRRVFMGDADGDGSPEAGRADVFQVLGDLWSGLMADDRDAVAQSIDRLDAVELQLELELTRVGAYSGRLERAGAQLRDEDVDLTARLSGVEDADTVEVISRLAEQQATLEASLRVASRLLGPSLVDFLG